MLHMKVRTFLYGGLAVSIAAALLTLAQSAPEAASENLQTRFEAYWQARVQNNMPLALQYEHPHSANSSVQKSLGHASARASLSQDSPWLTPRRSSLTQPPKRQGLRCG